MTTVQGWTAGLITGLLREDYPPNSTQPIFAAGAKDVWRETQRVLTTGTAVNDDCYVVRMVHRKKGYA